MPYGLRYFGHNGGGFGFSSEARWYPDAQLAIVVLTNSEPDAISATTEDLAAAVLPQPRAPGQFTGDPSPLVGKYKGPAGAGDMVVVVTQAPQGVMFSINGQPADTLPWIENWTFRKRDVLLSFRPATTSNQAAEMRFDTGGDHFILKRESSSAAVTMAAPLTAFEGNYEGVQPGAIVRIAVESDTLRLIPGSGGKIDLIPQSGTTFYIGREGSPRMIMFNLGPDGKAISVTLKGAGGERTPKKLP